MATTLRQWVAENKFLIPEAKRMPTEKRLLSMSTEELSLLDKTVNHTIWFYFLSLENEMREQQQG